MSSMVDIDEHDYTEENGEENIFAPDTVTNGETSSHLDKKVWLY